MPVKCAECQCTPQDCNKMEATKHCQNCTKEICCCALIHNKRKKATSMNLGLKVVDDDCCATDACRNQMNIRTPLKQQPPSPTTKKQTMIEFFSNVKALYAAALGIEILCIAAAEIGENTGLYVLGFNHIGVPFAYAMGYGLASFTTFATILGRYTFGSRGRIDTCCSVLEQDVSKSFFPNLLTTFKNFGSGLKKMKELPRQPNLTEILKATLTILITAETACIITAETVDLIFFKQAIYLSIPLALLAGAFTVVAPEAYRKVKKKHTKQH